MLYKSFRKAIVLVTLSVSVPLADQAIMGAILSYFKEDKVTKAARKEHEQATSQENSLKVTNVISHFFLLLQ